MTKLVHVRVVIPVGDDVTTDGVRRAVRVALEGLLVAKGEAEGVGEDLRIHWGAVDVHRIVERTATVAEAASPRRKRTPDTGPGLGLVK